MQRRRFILASGALLSMPWMGASPALAKTAKFTPVISAASDGEGKHIGVWRDDHWQVFQTIAHRGHDSLYHRQRRELVFFSRRPGREMYIVDSKHGGLLHTISSENGYHYYGHGCLSADGRYLYTTENHIAGDGAGSIGVYDCQQDYQCVGHMDCDGIGPHELALMPDGKTLAIAIGGIKTLPASGRKTLNPDTMTPALHYLDIASGQVVERHAAPHFQLSLRHLDVSSSGQVIIGAQFQGSLPSRLPLVYSHQRGGALTAMSYGELPLQFKQDYIASISIDTQGIHAVTSCPRDNLVCLWDLRSLQLQGVYPLRDSAGAIYDAAYQQFILSNGNGQLMALKPEQAKLIPLAYAPGTHWDNHLTLLR
ncbi:MAG: hypothetical protein ACI8RU_001302 [Zhongshania aliphaticivorans]|jgi:hypothetical protein|uniref:DUF1513 domain-containing protein n=1 Tax=Zhongshania aliphaticivorans TaxID=1470434 RepID=UPI0039E2B1B8